MQLHELDRDPDGKGMPISSALMMLAAICNDQKIVMDENIREAGLKALDGARVAMTTTLTVRQKEGGGFALDFMRIQAAPPAAGRLFTPH